MTTGVRVTVCVLLIFLAAKLVFFVVLALNSAFVMDEYWMVVHGLFSIDHLYRDIWPAKTVLYAAFFSIPHLLAGEAAEIMLVARLQSAAVAMAGLGLLYLIARQIGRSRIEAIFAIAIVLTFSSYIEWAFIVRPEPLALFLALAALWIVTRDVESLGACFLAGLLSGLAFLTIQKAAYFNLALGLALVGDGLARRSMTHCVLTGATLVFGWGLAVGAYYLFFFAQGADFGRMLDNNFAGPALQNALTGHQVYGNALGRFIGQTLMRDVSVYLISLAGFVLSARRLLDMHASERRAWIFTLVITVLIFSHRSPWPYNFIMMIPFLGLWSPVLIRAIPDGRRLANPILLGTLLVVAMVSFARNFSYLEHDNTFQQETVQRAERALKPGDSYFDGIGMVVTRGHAGWDLPGQVVSWDRPVILAIQKAAERGDMGHFMRIFDAAPKLWILSYRTSAFDKLLQPFFENAYLPVSSNIMISGVELTPGRDVIFMNHWPGNYRLYDSSSRSMEMPFEIDGQPVIGTVAIERGRHLLRLNGGDAPLYLLPADIADSPYEITTSKKPRLLFDRVYDF